MENKAKEEDLKKKLKNLLTSTQFCGLCYETGESFNSLNDQVCFITENWTEDVWLDDLCSYVFHESEDLPASFYICSECTEKLKQSYIFIKNSKLITNLLKTYLDDLESKSNDLTMHLKENIDTASSNIVIVLENNDVSIKTEETENEYVKEVVAKQNTNVVSFKCLKCNKKLPSFKLWNIHKSENKHEYKCVICSKTYQSQRHLKQHYQVHYKQICRICNIMMPEEELKDHLRKMHEDKVFICDICADVFYALNYLKTHAKIKHAIETDFQKCDVCLFPIIGKHKCKVACTECSVAPCIHYKYLIAYRNQKLDYSIKIKCVDCDYACRNKANLIAHVNREHLDHFPYECDICGQRFYGKSLLKNHINFHSENNANYDSFNHDLVLENKTDSKVIKTEFVSSNCSEVKKEIKRPQKAFACNLCKKKFLKEFTLKIHKDKAHGGVQHKIPRKKLECEICEKVFETFGELSTHRNSHGPNVKYTCRKCNKECETLQLLKAHSRRHDGPFAICDICGKRLRKVSIAKHLDTHKEGVIKCSTCGKRYGSLALLKDHEKCHRDSVPCPKCAKMIIPVRLSRHLKIHEVEENPELKESLQGRIKIKCQICDYVTWNKVLIECHMNRYHLKIKPYVCHICSKDFIGEHLLKKHIRTHTSEKPIVCMICGNRFANGRCLKMHLRLHTGEKNYPCDICGEKFRTSSIMNNHKVKKHSEKNHGCPLCGRKYHMIRQLRYHVITVHWKDKSKKFDFRKIKGLENHYHIFHDNRRIKMDEEDIDFHLPG